MHWSELSMELPTAPSGSILCPPLLSAFLNSSSINEMCFCARGWMRAQVSWRLPASYLRADETLSLQEQGPGLLIELFVFWEGSDTPVSLVRGLNPQLLGRGVGPLFSGLLVCPGWIPVLPWIGLSCPPPWPCPRMKGCFYISAESVVFPFILTRLPTVFFY